MSNRIFYSKYAYSKYAEDKNNLSQLRNRVNCSLENDEKNDNVNIQLEPVKKTFCMNTYKRAYYLKNKEIIVANAKRCEKLKRHAIKKQIYIYEPKFDSIDLRSRRSVLNEILICHFDVRLIYIWTSYNDFVDKFNSICDKENDFDSSNFIDDKTRDSDSDDVEYELA